MWLAAVQEVVENGKPLGPKEGSAQSRGHEICISQQQAQGTGSEQKSLLIINPKLQRKFWGQFTW